MKRIILLCAILSGLPFSRVEAAELKPETIAAFQHYVAVTEANMEAHTDPDDFLVVDQLPPEERRKAYSILQSGRIYIQELHTQVDHRPIPIPNGLVHHWVGVIFIPKATLEETDAVLRDYEDEPKIYKPEIRRAKLLSQDGNDSKTYLQLYNKSLITVVLDAYFDVTVTPIGSTRMESASHSTRIVEVVNPGEPDEHERNDGKDHGYMWRLNSYWRIEEKDGGVYLQNESISLSRTIPAILAWIVSPLTKSIPRDVLSHLLTNTRNAVLVSQASPKPERPEQGAS